MDPHIGNKHVRPPRRWDWAGLGLLWVLGTSALLTCLQAAPNEPSVAIVMQPPSREALLGSRVQFTVIATGFNPSTYQWLKDGVVVPGAINRDYVLPGVQLSDAGVYTVSARDVGGEVLVATAELAVSAALHDNLNDAAVITGASAILSGHNAYATAEFNEPYHAGSTTGKSVWWRWTAPWDGTVILDTTGSAFDTVLAVYTNSVVWELFEVASDRDGLFPIATSRVAFRCEAGVTYQIAVDGQRGDSGAVLLTMEAAPRPANDAFAARLPITGHTHTVAGSLLGATIEDGEPLDAEVGESSAGSIWWTWIAPVDGMAFLDTGGSSLLSPNEFGNPETKPALGVYTNGTGNGLADLRLVGAYPVRSLRSPTSHLGFRCVAGTSYHIVAKADPFTRGLMVLNLGLRAPLPNDDFAARILIPGHTNTVTGSNDGATVEPGERAHGFPGGRSVWWTWQAPAAGTLYVDTYGSSFETILAVYTGNTVSSLTLVGAPSFGFGTQTELEVVAGESYHIVVDGGYFEPSGSVVLKVRFPMAPANDLFAARLPLSGPSWIVTGHNVGATKELNEPGHGGNAGGKSVWWTWTSPASGMMNLDTTDSSFDTTLAVYRGLSVSALSLVASNNDVGHDFIRTSKLVFPAIAEVVYAIAVDGFDGARGTIVLNLAPVPANDSFTNRQSLAGQTVTVSGQNLGASKEVGEPAHNGDAGGRSVWWTWIATATGSVTVDTLGSSFETGLAVYTGNVVSNLVPVLRSGAGPGLTFSCLAGTAYHIAVDGRYFGARGDVTLNLRWFPPPAAPANDPFAARQSISGLPVSVSGNSTGAGKELGERAHNSNPGGASVWWTWTAPAASQVTVDATGSSFNTLLAVYTGGSLAALDSVAEDTGIVSFAALENVAYQIVVDGVDGASGPIVLHLSPTPANDILGNAPLINAFSNHLAGTTRGATGEPSEFDSDPSVWWEFRAPAGGRATLTFLSWTDLPYVVLYDANLRRIDSNARGTPARPECDLTFAVALGQTFYLRFTALPWQEPIDFGAQLVVTASPPNDSFAAPTPLPADVAIAHGSTIGASREDGEPPHGSQSVWWTWTAPRTGPVIMTTEGSTFDTSLSVYTGEILDSLTLIACNDDATVWATADAVPFDPISRVRFHARAGAVYQIAVAVARGQSGAVILNFPGVALERTTLLARTVLPDRSADLAAGLFISNLRDTPTGPLRVTLLSRAGFSLLERTADSCHGRPPLVAPDEVLGEASLPTPGFIGPSSSASMTVSGRCSPPFEGGHWGLGRGFAAVLEEFRAGAWQYRDMQLLGMGAWPRVGVFIGPGGGVITFSSGLGEFRNTDTYLHVNLGPPSAVRAGAMWRVSPTNYGLGGEYWRYTNYRPLSVKFSIYNTNFAIETKPVSGFLSPRDQQLTLIPSNTATLNLTYSVVPPELVYNPGNGLGLTGTKGTSYRIEFAPALPWQSGSALPQTMTLNAGTNWVPNTAPAGISDRFFRAVWLPE